jgi:preprotein translocase subunit SecF
VPFEIIPAGTRIDFISKRRICAGLSAAVLLASMMAVPVRGVRLGIDFAGGTEIQVRMSPDSDAEEGGIREIVGQIPGVEGLSVVRYGAAERDEFLLKFRGDLEAGEAEAAAEEAGAPAAEEEPEAIAAEEAGAPAAEGEASSPAQDVVAEVQSALSRAYGDVEIERVEFVGPRVGEELRADGMWALLLASIAILIYIAFRFSSRFAPGAIVAVLHDLLITAGIFVILGLEFDLSILAAMLAILGYSLNDTIIIYDRIRENMSTCRTCSTRASTRRSRAPCSPRGRPCWRCCRSSSWAER